MIVMKKRILSVFLTVAMLLTSAVFVTPTVSAEGDASAVRTTPTPADATGLWTDFAATAFEGDVAYGTEGHGTAENPYKIATPEQLAYLAKLSNEYTAEGDSKTFAEDYFVLTQNIDLTGHNWVPISATHTTGTGYKFTDTRLKVQMAFKGNFDGQGYAVTGITFGDEMLNSGKVPAEIAAFGLFGVLSGTVKNLDVEGTAVFTGLASFNATNFKNGCVAIFAGVTLGAIVENVNANVFVDVTTTKAEIQVAGMIGYATDSSVVSNSVLSGSVKCTNSGISLAGGFIACVAEGAELYNCTNYADVLAVTTKASTIVIVGGFVGKSQSTSPASKLELGSSQNLTGLSACTNYGKISAEGSSKCKARVGSMIGNAGRTSGKGDYYIFACVNHGEILANYYDATAKQAGIASLVGLHECGSGFMNRSFSSVYAMCTDATTAAKMSNGLVKIVANKNLNNNTITTEGFLIPDGNLFVTSDSGLVTVADGARLRLNPSNEKLATLRFDCVLDPQVIDTLADTKTIVGTILVSADIYAAAAEGASSTAEAVANLAHGDYRNMKATYGADGVFSALYANITAADYGTEFIAIPYLTIILDEKTGESYTVYDEYVIGDDARTVSVKGIAAQYIEIRSDDAANPNYISGDQIEILESYLNK